MFINFFYYLKAGGLKVSLTEWMTLLEALRANLHDASMMGFYTMCRAIVVKSETDFDLFDRLFLEFFGELEAEQRVPEEIMKWLDHPELIPPEFKEFLEHTDLSIEEIEELFRQRLEDQKEEHNKGNKWIGTGGYTAYGHHGRKLGGIRVGGESVYRSAYRVASERKYRDWRRDKTIDSRQFQFAFRRLRQLSDHTQQEKTEIDVDETVKKTGDKGGILHVVKKPPRNNVIKLMLLIDSGGSMDYYQSLCTTLFQSVKKAGGFADVRFYYFHNYIGNILYTSPAQRISDRIQTDWVLQNIDSTYKVIIVGDGQMSMYELFNPFGSGGMQGGLYTHLGRFGDFREKYPDIIWLHPQETPKTEGYWNQTWFRLAEVFPMYQLTLDGLNEGLHKLLVSR